MNSFLRDIIDAYLKHQDEVIIEIHNVEMPSEMIGDMPLNANIISSSNEVMLVFRFESFKWLYSFARYLRGEYNMIFARYGYDEINRHTLLIKISKLKKGG